MTAAELPGGDGSSPPGSSTPGRVVATLFVILLLMAFSICALLLGQPALAMFAGTAAVGLAGKVVSHLLSRSTKRDDGSPPSGEIEGPRSG